jgi:carboxypeptidase A4
MRSLVLLSCLLGAALAAKSYDGYTVFRTGKLNATSAKFLRSVQMSSNQIDFWTEPVPGRRADMMVNEKLAEETKQMLADNHVHFTTMIQDVQKLIEENDALAKSVVRAKPSSNKAYELDWDDYYDHDILNQFLDAQAAANDWAEVINIGQSYEGRDMNVLAITKAGPGAPNVWLEAGIHAREWIAPAVATFLMRELVENYAAHPDYIDKLNWYLLPSANPDGYQYSRDEDRMWRKTRSPTGSIFGCKGVDPNRNWGFHWGESGVSNDKCSDIYPGPNAFSEIEMMNIKNFVESLAPVPVLGHCFHSYSQLWLWPYGYAYDAYPPNREEVEQLAIDASDALYKVHGTIFDPINSAELYPAAGASDDWYKGSLGTRFAFTTELRDTGRHGFILPAKEIIPSGEEMWAGFEVVINKLIEVSEK